MEKKFIYIKSIADEKLLVKERNATTKVLLGDRDQNKLGLMNLLLNVRLN